MSKIAVRVLATGRVQGVGFRAAVRREALRLDLTGSAVNLTDGRVEIRAEGSRDAGESLVTWMQGDDPPGAVTDVEIEWTSPTGAAGFVTG